MFQHAACIGVGSNLGDKRKSCQRGIAALVADGASRILTQSRMYRTEPVDYLDQDWFVNCAVLIETRLNPFELLTALQTIQKQAGRIRDTVRFGPRILDMDILYVDSVVIDRSDLILPHPRLHLRRFVLQPMCDIDPDWRHPILNQTVREMLNHLDSSGQEVTELP